MGRDENGVFQEGHKEDDQGRRGATEEMRCDKKGVGVIILFLVIIVLELIEIREFMERCDESDEDEYYSVY
jgi:hypothetical protein